MTWPPGGQVGCEAGPLRVVARADPEVVGWLRGQFGKRLSVGATGADGRVEVVVRGHSSASVAAEFAGFGGRIEVVEPPEVRRLLADLGTDLVRSYEHLRP